MGADKAERGPEKNNTSSILCPRLQEVTDILWGHGHGPFIHNVKDRRLIRNPDLVFEDGHGGDWSRDGSDVSPDLITIMHEQGATPKEVFDRANEVGHLSWKVVRVPIEVRMDSNNDMRSANSDEQKNQVPRLLKYMVSAFDRHFARTLVIRFV